MFSKRIKNILTFFRRSEKIYYTPDDKEEARVLLKAYILKARRIMIYEMLRKNPERKDDIIKTKALEFIKLEKEITDEISRMSDI